MLLPRILTALALLAVLLPALAADSPLPFQWLTLVLIGAAGWEWARLNHPTGGAVAVAVGIGLALGCWAVLGLLTNPASLAPLWWLATLAWVVGAGAALRGGPSRWPTLPWGVRWVLGVLLLGTAWLAMVGAHAKGVNFLLSAMCVVWMADIAAYFGGRAFGKRKLAPTISPGKSWAGVYSGAIGVGLLAVAWLIADVRLGAANPSLFTVLWHRLGPVGFALSLVGLTALSVVGDLFESLVKRAAGAKDSSRLLPGHGGVLDRVDALLPVLPAAMALASL
ncbi:phosphatidate cytidylyltransferase [Ideonella sp. A 288]|uniref:phosphatidate cytidylyltransferase n=1 Tax=Ideonella sp. A 288 TaxID=1962181 RepID=UPI000B4B2274|nr:phosphatidate cytidylyltransferase [Ideonella sp. A 288]